MSVFSRQPGLFEMDQQPDGAEAALARARMREMIDQISTLAVPPWADQTGVILLDGAFRRALRLVPTEEAEMLWAEFDANMERLYAIWARGQPASET
jgi:hypothetical protein